MPRSARSNQVSNEREATSSNKIAVIQPTAKAYSYIRMSTKEQLQGDSLRRQYEKTENYVKQHNLELADNFDDIGVSAYRGLHAVEGALGRFLEAIKNGDIPRGSYLIIESMDRLTRQAVMTAIGLLNQIITSGITVVTLDDGMKYSVEEFESKQHLLLTALISMMRAHEESLRKSGLLSDAWSEKRKKLRNEGKVLTATTPAWLRVDKSKGIVDQIPERVAVVQEIFDLACSGYGIYSIARLLNERGKKAWGITRQTKLRPKNKAKPIWRDSYIKKILVNRAVLGEFQPHKLSVTPERRKLRIPEGEVVKGYYPRVISPEVFRDAQLAMDRRRNGARGRKGPTYSNLFTGMIHCIHCGSGMRYLDKGGSTKDGKYLKCSVAVAGADCVPKSYKYEAVEQVILSALESLDVEKVLGGEALSRRLSEKKNEREMSRIFLEDAEKKINNINELILSQGGSMPASTLSSLRKLEHDQGNTKLLIAALDAQIDDMLVIDPEKRMAVLNDLMKAIRNEGDTEKKSRSRRTLAAELQRMIDTITLSPDAQFAYEIADVDPSWMRKYGVSGLSHLQHYLNEFGFKISIRYRTGEQQIITGIDGRRLKLKWDKKFRDMKALSKFEASSK